MHLRASSILICAGLAAVVACGDSARAPYYERRHPVPDGGPDAGADGGRDPTTVGVGGVGGGGAGASFDDTGLVLWLDAHAAGDTDGQSVTRWRDSSARGNDAIEDAEGPPVYVADGLNGNPVVRFETKLRFLKVAEDASYKKAQLTVFFVGSSEEDHANIVGYPVIEPSPDNGAVMLAPFYWWTFFHARDDNIDVRIGEDMRESTANAWDVPAVYSYRTALRTVQRNGEDFFSPPSAGMQVTYGDQAVGLQVGWMVGDIAELLLFDGTLSEARVSEVNDYLLTRWDITP